MRIQFNIIDGDTLCATVVVSGEHIRASAEMGTRPKGTHGDAEAPGAALSENKQTSRRMKRASFLGSGLVVDPAWHLRPSPMFLGLLNKQKKSGITGFERDVNPK